MASHAQPLSADALPRAVGAQRGLRVCHIVSGDLWAGAEVQVATVASYLVEQPDVNLSAVLLDEGRLASEPYSQRSRPVQGQGDANPGRSEARTGDRPARTPRRHRGQALARQGASVLSPSRPANS